MRMHTNPLKYCMPVNFSLISMFLLSNQRFFGSRNPMVQVSLVCVYTKMEFEHANAHKSIQSRTQGISSKSSHDAIKLQKYVCTDIKVSSNDKMILIYEQMVGSQLFYSINSITVVQYVIET